MKHSLRVKSTLILTLSMTILIFLCWLANKLFLENYYEKQKVKLLSDSYYQVNNIVGTDEITDQSDILTEIEKVEASYSVSVYIISQSRSLFGDTTLSLVYPLPINMGDVNSFGAARYDRYKRIIAALQKYIFPSDDQTRRDTPVHLTSVEDTYDIYKIFDTTLDSSYIDLIGVINQRYIVFIRSCYDNISESAAISNSFMTIVGISVILLGTFIMYLFSRSFTKPILELAEISDKMASLDFDRHYKGNSHDEIGTLGNSINVLSDKLEKTITELKTANLELEKDIAQKQAIDEMRKEFLSNVSHELKTPIALIQGYAEGLQDNINDDPESRAFYCDVIIDEARKMNNLVRKLLALNEIESGSNILNLNRFDLTELTTSIISSLDILVKQKNASIVFAVKESVYVWADDSYIEQVLTNYLSNALNHLSGRNVIDISFTKTDSKIRVSVFNTGNNIPEEDIPKLWDKFYKVDKARTREYGGSGIGLSIVKAIMDLHNQAYGVVNHSTGVEFWFELDMKSDE